MFPSTEEERPCDGDGVGMSPCNSVPELLSEASDEAYIPRDPALLPYVTLEGHRSRRPCLEPPPKTLLPDTSTAPWCVDITDPTPQAAV